MENRLTPTPKEVEDALELAREWEFIRYPYTNGKLVSGVLLHLHAECERLKGQVGDSRNYALGIIDKLERAEKERDEWRAKALDCEKHPVVSRLISERDSLKAKLEKAKGVLKRACACRVSSKRVFSTCKSCVALKGISNE